jgi:hypothetical protein
MVLSGIEVRRLKPGPKINKIYDHNFAWDGKRHDMVPYPAQQTAHKRDADATSGVCRVA